MSTRSMTPPLSRVRFGLGRADITPPVGIYHRLWGAARHDRATGVHRPLSAEVMAIGPLDGAAPPLIRAQLDLCGLVQSQHDGLIAALSAATGVPPAGVVVAYSHTHAGGWFVPDRVGLPGGELIAPYLATLAERLQQAARAALAAQQEAVIAYAAGRSDMGANRDYWDDVAGAHACGFNPDGSFDDTVLVGRVTDPAGRPLATLVNYACHPTTLAWENSLISPDFVGALREEVERATGAPCVFLQGACGDVGPRHGFVGDVAIADRNGRRLAYAALAALTGLGPPATSFDYLGPVVSGATLGAWGYRPLDADRLARSARFAAATGTVDLPLKPRPDRAALQAELADWAARQQAADARGDAPAARDYSARAERARRWLARLDDLPAGATYPLRYSLHLLGDAAWITCGGEPYNALQAELRRRFPDLAVLVSPLAGDLQVAYLLPADRYGRGLYQEEPSSLGPGCLELLADALAAKLTALL